MYDVSFARNRVHPQHVHDAPPNHDDYEYISFTLEAEDPGSLDSGNQGILDQGSQRVQGISDFEAQTQDPHLCA